MPALSGNQWRVTPRAADIDGDGDLDVMVFNGGPYLLVNLAGVLSPSPTQLPAIPSSFTADHWFADYDGDGDPDIFANSGSFLFQNQGNGTFVDVTATAFSSTPSQALACFDVDNDGDLDLVTSSCIWSNNGNGTFAAQVVATSLYYAYNAGVAAADFDGDGDIDLPGQANFLRQVNAPTPPVRGGNYSVEFHARPGSVVGACAALAAGQLSAGPFGVLRLDPATAAPLAVATIATGPLVLSWTLPNLPALAGLELHYQALVVDPINGPVLSNDIVDVVQ